MQVSVSSSSHFILHIAADFTITQVLSHLVDSISVSLNKEVLPVQLVSSFSDGLVELPWLHM